MRLPNTDYHRDSGNVHIQGIYHANIHVKNTPARVNWRPSPGARAPLREAAVRQEQILGAFCARVYRVAMEKDTAALRHLLIRAPGHHSGGRSRLWKWRPPPHSHNLVQSMIQSRPPFGYQPQYGFYEVIPTELPSRVALPSNPFGPPATPLAPAGYVLEQLPNGDIYVMAAGLSTHQAFLSQLKRRYPFPTTYAYLTTSPPKGYTILA